MAAVEEMLFQLAFALMTAHELDAVAHREWRVLPITSFLPDNVGYTVFIGAHVPLVMAVIRGAWQASPATRMRVRYGFSVFCVVHVGLHAAYHTHPEYRFAGALSNSLIIACGAAGLAWLAARHWMLPDKAGGAP
eukprot:m.261167 g.261167  ORF g.261167 m.261167 type:complete len:135 (-) comp24282_c0_seq1:84-488(-)